MIQIQLNFIKTIRLYYVDQISLVLIYIFLKLKQYVIYCLFTLIQLTWFIWIRVTPYIPLQVPCMTLPRQTSYLP